MHCIERRVVTVVKRLYLYMTPISTMSFIYLQPPRSKVVRDLCLTAELTFDQWIAISTPSLKQRYMYVLVHPRKNDPVHQCYSLGTLKNLVCQVLWALQDLALWATN